MAHTRLFLVRHGATVLSAEDRFAGSTDAPLSQRGRAQAGRLARRLAGEPVAAVIASPLGRALDTARILAAPHGLEVETRAELREIDHGRWETLTRREVGERYPDEMAMWEADPFTFAPHGGESGLAVTARALPALLAIVRRLADRCDTVDAGPRTAARRVSRKAAFPGSAERGGSASGVSAS
ncbi:MAG TPA: histidine phosphatase family protein [Dongiaceae bacterium]|nr:histidine phosphatase family protein [Dongiaceae bacterium]